MKIFNKKIVLALISSFVLGTTTMAANAFIISENLFMVPRVRSTGQGYEVYQKKNLAGYTGYYKLNATGANGYKTIGNFLPAEVNLRNGNGSVTNNVFGGSHTINSSNVNADNSQNGAFDSRPSYSGGYGATDNGIYQYSESDLSRNTDLANSTNPESLEENISYYRPESYNPWISSEEDSQYLADSGLPFPKMDFFASKDPSFAVLNWQGKVNDVFYFKAVAESEYFNDYEVEVRFDFNNDGIRETVWMKERNFAFRFTKKGIFQVTMEVMNPAGNISKITKTVYIQ
jgi:hypothetical protein